MRGSIIQELFACIEDGLSAIGLLRRNGAEGCRQSGVNSAGVVQECSDYLLDVFDLLGRKFRRCVWVLCELHFVAILDGRGLIW